MKAGNGQVCRSELTSLKISWNTFDDDNDDDEDDDDDDDK